MVRRIAMIFLALGAIAGFASGTRRVVHHGHSHHRDLEARVADVCVEAARRSTAKDPQKP